MLTLTNVALLDDTPEEVSAVVTVGRLVKRFFGKEMSSIMSSHLSRRLSTRAGPGAGERGSGVRLYRLIDYQRSLYHYTQQEYHHPRR